LKFQKERGSWGGERQRGSPLQGLSSICRNKNPLQYVETRADIGIFVETKNTPQGIFTLRRIFLVPFM